VGGGGEWVGGFALYMGLVVWLLVPLFLTPSAACHHTVLTRRIPATTLARTVSNTKLTRGVRQ